MAALLRRANVVLALAYRPGQISDKVRRVIKAKTAAFSVRCTSTAFRSAYTNIDEEIPDPLPATIKGEIPAWLSGSLIRNGPGLFEVGPDSYNHLFDGLALLSRFNFDGGKVTYQSRFLRSNSYLKAMEHNRIVVSEFGTMVQPDPCLGLFGRLMWRFNMEPPTDNCNINCVFIGDECYALTETNSIHRIDPTTLETREKVDISKTLAVHTATAHPHTANDGTVYNMGNRYSKKCHYCILKVPPPDPGVIADPMSKASVLCSIPASHKFPSYFHSFGMTDNYLVFVEQPLVLDVLRIRFSRLLKLDSFMELMKYEPKMPARFHLIRRGTGELVGQKYLADAFFFFHHVNAYEEAGQLVVDLCAYEDESILHQASLEEMRKVTAVDVVNQPKRFVLPLDPGKEPGVNLNTLGYSKAKAIIQEDGNIHLTPENISDKAIELPTLNYGKYNGKLYKYFYGIKGFELLKADTRTGVTQMWQEEGFVPSEPIFVPSPGASSEDDGVVICVMVSLLVDKPSYLLVLDARDLTEVGRAEVAAPVPYGIHGLYRASSG